MTQGVLFLILILKTIIRFLFGVSLFAIGIVMTINANLGMAPWDVLHKGISLIFNITFGQASIYVGIVIIVINFLFRERIGWSTIFNIFFIGMIVDFLMLNSLIPIFNNIFLQLFMMCTGLFIIGVGAYFYLSIGFGSGPRDGLMIGLTKRTNKSVRFIRNSIEISVATIGYLLGGPVGIGTVIMATTTGYFIQFAFTVFKFDVKTIKHRYIDNDIQFIYKKIQEKSIEDKEK